MKYGKPEVVVLGTASATIESGGGKPINVVQDQLHPEQESNGAYEADE
jgi:hypothetical protein